MRKKCVKQKTNQEFEMKVTYLRQSCAASPSLGRHQQGDIKLNLLRSSWSISLLHLTAQHGYTLSVALTCPHKEENKLNRD